MFVTLGETSTTYELLMQLMILVWVAQMVSGVVAGGDDALGVEEPPCRAWMSTGFLRQQVQKIMILYGISIRRQRI